MNMKVYIDDIRDPQKYLTPEQAAGIIWIKEWWEARNFLFKNEAQIEEIHFDNYLNDPDNHTGMEIFLMVLFERAWGKGSDSEEFVNLKRIYLHSSDNDIITEAMETYADEIEKSGIEVINNSQENNY